MTSTAIIPTTFTSNILTINTNTDVNAFKNGTYIASTSSNLADYYGPYNVFNSDTSRIWYSLLNNNTNNGYIQNPYTPGGIYQGGGSSTSTYSTKAINNSGTS